MKIQTSELLKAVALSKGVCHSSFVTDVGEGVVSFVEDHVVRYDGRRFIGIPLPTGMECSVDGERLRRVLLGTEDPFLEISVGDTEVIVGADTIRAGLPVLSEVDALEHAREVLTTGFLWKKLPDGFGDGLQLCAFSASSDLTRNELTGVFVDQDRIVASDDYRLSCYSLQGLVEDSMLLPAVSVVGLHQLQLSEYGIVDSWVYFRTVNGEIVGILSLVGEYPDTSEFWDVTGIRLVLPTGLDKVMGVVGDFSEGLYELDKRVFITIGGGVMTCRAESPTGWIEKPVKIRYDREEVSFWINPRFFSEVLKGKGGIRMVISEDTVLLASGNFKHVVALA